jgi:CarD family transcriptional regulator
VLTQTEYGIKITFLNGCKPQSRFCVSERAYQVMTFQVGEKVVYPNHGVATIENISSRAFAGQHERYYLLKLSANAMTVLVPFSHAEELRLRRVTRNGELARVVTFLSEGRCRRYSDWKDRFKENTEKMRDGSLLAVAEVLKSLLILQTEKVLSFREKKMLDRARHMLLTELSTSRGLREPEATELLDKALAKAQLHMPEPL